MKSIATTVLLMGALAGCSSTEGVTRFQPTRSVSATEALVFPPPGGPAIIAVVERRFRNGIEQDIALRTQSSVPGQNSIKVKFVGPGIEGTNTDKTLSSARLTDLAVSREMRSEVPGIAMVRTPSYLQNNYGPFSYAVGRSRGGDTCVYGWQQIRSSPDARNTLHNLGIIQMRLRLCDAVLSEQALLATMYGYTINGSFTGWQWNPYGRTDGVDPNLGRPGHPVYPAAAAIDHYAAPLGYEPQPAVRRAAAAPARPRVAPVRQAARTVTPPVSTAPTGPMVPLPPTNSSMPAAATANGRPAMQNQNSIRVPTPDCVGGSGTRCP
ncbi:cellulose biosynthesis protein BcsN [Neorhizobium sp. JUb45]|uniref:cellulose biosynthesis protein BcsN n=1 Tax=unclassified Neorhizobium TaxID=2629175 RepID=UPI001043FA42|nr:cellulose biosynthesis protein BcsN [Neorhizobium sp. JUb45]TCQ99735.1 cellulose biosynthesis protein BcsN [Neorhizobium sp. JUb45]